MAHFGVGDGGDELSGEQGVALDALVDDETAGNQPQPDSYREDDGQADPGVPAQEVERLAWGGQFDTGG